LFLYILDKSGKILRLFLTNLSFSLSHFLPIDYLPFYRLRGEVSSYSRVSIDAAVNEWNPLVFGNSFNDKQYCRI